MKALDFDLRDLADVASGRCSKCGELGPARDVAGGHAISDCCTAIAGSEIDEWALWVRKQHPTNGQIVNVLSGVYQKWHEAKNAGERRKLLYGQVPPYSWVLGFKVLPYRGEPVDWPDEVCLGSSTLMLAKAVFAAGREPDPTPALRRLVKLTRNLLANGRMEEDEGETGF